MLGSVGICMTAPPKKVSKERTATSSVCASTDTMTATTPQNGIMKLPISLKGIKNKINNCWLNSLLQCLSVTTLGDITTEDDTAFRPMLFSYLASFFKD